MTMLWVMLGLVAASLGVPALRRRLITPPLMRLVSRQLPPMSETERVALEAGTVWWDGELFSGKPDWRKLLSFRSRPVSPRERAFLEGPVEELCRMLDDWEIGRRGDLPPAVWQFLKRHRFFGMIVPEEYGGLGFSAAAHSAVVTKLASRSELRHHVRARSLPPAGDRHRAAPRPDGRPVPERPDGGPRRVRAGGLHHRRAGHGRPGLAHADGEPGRGPLDLAPGPLGRTAPSSPMWRSRSRTPPAPSCWASPTGGAPGRP